MTLHYITAQQWPLYSADFRSGTKVIFWGDMCICLHAYLFMHIFYKPYGQQIQIHFENYAEIHFEIQKSTWNTEIQSEIRNPREIQWISKSRTPRRAVADPSPRIHADRLLKQIVSFGSLQPFTVRILGDFPSFLSALAVSCLLA